MRISDWSSDVCSSDLRRRPAGADGPDRLIGDDERRARAGGRDGAVKLAAHHVQRLSGVAFRFRLADADDGCQAVADRGFGLGAHLFAGFMLVGAALAVARSEEHTSELQSLMRISYAVFCLKKK